MVARAPDPRRVRAQQVKEAADALRWIVTVDEKEYTFRLSDVTALDVSALRRDTQFFDVRKVVLDAVDEHVDALAAIVWLARRQAGEVGLRWLDVAEAITVGTVMYIRDERELDDESEVFLDPPPSGGGSGD